MTFFCSPKSDLKKSLIYPIWGQSDPISNQIFHPGTGVFGLEGNYIFLWIGRTDIYYIVPDIANYFLF